MTIEQENQALKNVLYRVWAKMNVACSVVDDPTDISDPLGIATKLIHESIEVFSACEALLSSTEIAK